MPIAHGRCIESYGSTEEEHIFLDIKSYLPSACWYPDQQHIKHKQNEKQEWEDNKHQCTW